MPFTRPRLRALCRRSLIAALLLYQAFFLNVFLPGHTRGVITLGPSSSAPSAAGSPCGMCCTNTDKVEHGGKRAGQPAEPTQSERARCAVCHFALRMTPAPALDLKLPELALLTSVKTPLPAIVQSLPFAWTYFGRAPPVA